MCVGEGGLRSNKFGKQSALSIGGSHILECGSWLPTSLHKGLDHPWTVVLGVGGGGPETSPLRIPRNACTWWTSTDLFTAGISRAFNVFLMPWYHWRGKVSKPGDCSVFPRYLTSELPYGTSHWANVPQNVFKETLTLDFQLVCTKGYMDGDS